MQLPLRTTVLSLVAGAVTLGFLTETGSAQSGRAERWIPLFNGRNLSGWTPKIKGYLLGENFGNTFRVQDGAIKVSYDGYGGKFENRFGHLFYRNPFTSYKLRLEYRFTGEQLPDAPGWAFRNSGVMIHSQAPESIRKDQDFPVSVEVQFLGGDGKNERTTGNMCSPGTHVVIEGKLVTQHCVNSKSKTYHGDQWVRFELQVHPNGKIVHLVNGEKVMEYEGAQLDENDADAKQLIKNGEKMLKGGFISLQSESHPIEFRKIELAPLE